MHQHGRLAPLGVAMLGFFVVALDAQIVKVALPDIGASLGGGLSGLQWVVTGYTLTFSSRQRRLTGVDGIVLSLAAKGLTTGEISAHLAEVYGAQVSKATITAITDRAWRRCRSGRTGRWMRSIR
jgi:MFS family permease